MVLLFPLSPPRPRKGLLQSKLALNLLCSQRWPWPPDLPSCPHLWRAGLQVCVPPYLVLLFCSLRSLSTNRNCTVVSLQTSSVSTKPSLLWLEKTRQVSYGFPRLYSFTLQPLPSTSLPIRYKWLWYGDDNILDSAKMNRQSQGATYLISCVRSRKSHAFLETELLDLPALKYKGPMSQPLSLVVTSKHKSQKKILQTAAIRISWGRSLLLLLLETHSLIVQLRWSRLGLWHKIFKNIFLGLGFSSCIQAAVSRTTFDLWSLTVSVHLIPTSLKMLVKYLFVNPCWDSSNFWNGPKHTFALPYGVSMKSGTQR